VLLENSDGRVNTAAHRVFQSIISKPEPLRDEIIPLYLKQSLENYPKYTQLNSFALSAAAMVSKLPPDNPLVVHCLQSIKEKIRSSPEQDSGVPYMVILFFELISYVHRNTLPLLLTFIEEFVKRSPKKMQELWCKLLFKVISKNYDYSRKDVCVKWYLQLCAELGLNKKNSKH